MLTNAFFVTSIVCLAGLIWLLQELEGLAPFRNYILHTYWKDLARFAVEFFLNVLAITFTISRRFFLKDTGRKLEHLEKELRVTQSVSAELGRRIAEEE